MCFNSIFKNDFRIYEDPNYNCDNLNIIFEKYYAVGFGIAVDSQNQVAYVVRLFLTNQNSASQTKQGTTTSKWWPTTAPTWTSQTTQNPWWPTTAPNVWSSQTTQNPWWPSKQPQQPIQINQINPITDNSRNTQNYANALAKIKNYLTRRLYEDIQVNNLLKIKK